MSDKSANENTKKKTHVTGGEIAAIIIIALIVVALIGTTVPLIGAQPNQENVFGTYDGVDITFAQDSVLYDKYVELAQKYADQMDDTQVQIQVWQQAYQQALVFEAFSQDAKKAGIVPSEELISRKVIEAGVYNDEDGNFDKSIYDSKTSGQRSTIFSSYQKQYPYNTIVTDYNSTLVSSDEISYVAEEASIGRAFDYILVDYNSYPDNLAKEFGEADPEQFNRINISIISAEDETTINAAYSDLEEGTSWDDTVASYSEDSYKSSNGSLGTAINPWQLNNNFNEETDLDKILSLETGTYTEPIEGKYGWTIYRLDSDIVPADFSTAVSLADVKRYLSINKADEVAPYIESTATQVAEEAATDFEKAATDYNFQTVSVASTPNNIGGYDYMNSLQYTDYGNYLYQAAQEEDVSTTLYTSEEGFVTAPIKSGEDYIIVRIGAEAKDTQTESMLKTVYSYYAKQVPITDATYAVFTSPKLEDNFTAQILKILGEQQAE